MVRRHTKTRPKSLPCLFSLRAIQDQQQLLVRGYGYRSQPRGDVPCPSDGYHASYPASGSAPRAADPAHPPSGATLPVGYPSHPVTCRKYNTYVRHYGNDEESDSEFLSSDTDGMLTTIIDNFELHSPENIEIFLNDVEP